VRLNLPTGLLRSFVTIVDTGSMIRASEHIALTQSALSLQMKRLADLLQQQLFRREQGALSLTPAGETLLIHAREILELNDRVVASLGAGLSGPVRIGMVQDFADAILSRVLSRFKRLNPSVRLEMRVGTSTDLRDSLCSDLIDIALYLDGDRSEDTVAMANMAWYGDEQLLEEPSLPVALMNRPCIFREAALAALDATGIAYNIALETPSTSVLKAAVSSGLSATCRTAALMGRASRSLPIVMEELPQVAYNLGVRRGNGPIVETLTALIRTELEEL